MSTAAYESWSNQELVQRVELLEAQLRKANNSQKTHENLITLPIPPKRPKIVKAARAIDASKYSTRHIALKFAYLGQGYNGLEYHKHNDTPLPTVEETIWHALRKTQLIFPNTDSSDSSDTVTWEGCEFSKCGRTDRGVSAFGQVVGLRVRSNRPLKGIRCQQPSHELPSESPPALGTANVPTQSDVEPEDVPDANACSEDEVGFDQIRDELPFVRILNRVLPEDIRVLAWCPSPPGFSARFSCRERRYRYFFTQPAFPPPLSSQPDHSHVLSDRGTKAPPGYLNIEAMQTAAKKFEGLHDFRNFCKIDPSKQIENFQRRIFRSEIISINPSSPSITNTTDIQRPAPSHPKPPPSNLAHSATTHAFILHGSAFLWHQVRHMVAILFLIGQGLEPPSLIDDLLDISKTPSKPRYEMADDAPLVLWDCIFPHDLNATNHGGSEDSLPWITESDQLARLQQAGPNGAKSGKGAPRGGVATESMWRVWRKAKVEEILAGELLDVVAGYDDTLTSSRPGKAPQPAALESVGAERIFLGGNEARLVGKYVPVMERPRMDSADVVNARWVKKKKKGEVGQVGAKPENK